jgi:hypothetical protein
MLPCRNRGKLSEQQQPQDNASTASQAGQQQQQPQRPQLQPPAAAVGFRQQQRPIPTRPVQPGSQARRELQQQQQQQVPTASQPGIQQPASAAIPTKPLDSAAVAAAARSSANSGTAATSTGAAAAGTAAIQPVTGASAASTTAGAASNAGGMSAGQVADPLHDDSAKATKETAQLAALSRVVQQQQDTISRQVSPRLAGQISQMQVPPCYEMQHCIPLPSAL